MKYIGLLHLSMLCGITHISLRSLGLSLPATIAAALILIWSNLVFTGQILSLFHLMDSFPLFFGSSLLLAAIIGVILKWLDYNATIAATLPIYSMQRPRYEKQFLYFFVMTGAIVLGLNVLIAVTHLASNPDTITYRFPRVYWYLTQGSLAHFANGTDPRIVFYPTNGTMLYIPLVLYRFGALWFNLPTLLAWCAIPFVTYGFARELGAARLWAAAAGWAIALTPNVLIQALSTNDEILAAVSLLAGLYFIHRWSSSKSLVDLLLGFFGGALSAGCKLHIFFYWPYLAVVFIVVILNWRRWLVLVKPLMSARGMVTCACCGIAAFATVLSFMIYNFLFTGHVSDFNFAKLVLNTPFDIFVAAQTIVVYLSQIILSPIMDIFPNFGYSGARIPYYASFNVFFAPLFAWVNNGPSYTSVGYRFTGVVSNLAFLLNEQTVMLGFSWLLSIICIVWLVRHRSLASRWSPWLAFSFPAWFLCWAASTKYIEGIAVYIAYAAIISSPAWAFAMAPIVSTFWSRLRWVALGFVCITHVLTAITVFGLNTSRSAAAALSGKFKLPRSVAFTIEPSVTDELKLASAGLTHHTIDWGQPNWAFMAFNPQIPQKLQSTSISYPGTIDDPVERELAYDREVMMPRKGDKTLHIYPIPQFPAFGHAVIKVSAKSSPGLTLIGAVNFAFGPEWVFAAGNQVEKRHPDASGYLVFSFSEANEFGRNLRPVLEISARLIGLGENDDLSFRYSVAIDGKMVDRTEWAKIPAARLSTVGLGSANGVLTIEVRNNKTDGHVDSAEVKLRGTTPAAIAR